MKISPFDLILLLGSVQGAILGTLLWINKKGNPLANRLLATLIGLLASMSLAVGVPNFNRWWGLAMELLPLIMAMPIGPLIYFYTKSLLDPTFQIGQREQRHFYPVILDLGAKLVGWVFIVGLVFGFFDQKSGPKWGAIMDEYNTYVDIPRWLSVTVYLIITKRLINKNQASGQQEQPHLRWLGQFTNVFLAFQTIWLIHLVPYIVPAWRGPLLDRFGWYPIYIPIAILIYWLGFKGYLHTRSEATKPTNSLSSKSAGSDLSSDTIERVMNALSKAMEQDKLYLDSDLSIDKLGQHLQLPPKLISAILNQHMHKNFNGFVNEHRVDEVKRRVLDPAYDHLTLTGIAFESGFNSQATFQRTFRQLMGVSPGEYVAHQKKKASQIGI